MEKIGHRYVIQYFHLKGLSPINIKAELDPTLGESAPSFTTIKYWVTEFKAMDRSDHVTLNSYLSSIFNLCNPISVKN